MGKHFIVVGDLKEGTDEKLILRSSMIEMIDDYILI